MPLLSEIKQNEEEIWQTAPHFPWGEKMAGQTSESLSTVNPAKVTLHEQ